MTSAQTMLKPARIMGGATMLVALALFAGCTTTKPGLAPLRSSDAGERVWGVVPIANESGVSVIDAFRVADALMEEIQLVDGLDAIPVNRVVAAMRSMDMRVVATPGDAVKLMNVLKLEGLVVGTITAYDPYRPMTLGMALEVYTRDIDPYGGLDPRAVTRATGGEVASGEIGPPRPTASAAGIFRAAHADTRAALAAYADARHEPGSAYGPEIYEVSMELYTRFVCYRLLRELLAEERVGRLAVVEPEETRR